MLTEKDYCDYDTCVALKELGYPLTSKEVRHEDKAVFVPGVLLYSAQKWLREEEGILINTPFLRERNSYGEYTTRWWCVYTTDTRAENHVLCDEGKGWRFWASYEEALLEGIKAAIEVLKEGK